MSDALEKALGVMQKRVGEQTSQSEWFEVTQERINDYADVSMDHQWIHVDVERAKEGPFGVPIAHGNLTLAIMGHLPVASVASGEALEGQKLGINYGFDRIRFPAPVPVGIKIRATSTLKRVEIKGGMLETMNEIVVEAQGSDKPVCVAESVGRLVF
jgi:acyl dehydratase